VNVFLKLLFGSILVFMLIMTVRTCLPVSLWSAMPWFAANPWAMATLYITFGFSTFFSWLAWQERSPGAKLMWFVLIMAGGAITVSLYMLLQLFGLRPDEPASASFRQEAA
jgi:hypothetical protein